LEIPPNTEIHETPPWRRRPAPSPPYPAQLPFLD
jgi:hypothetical protein